MDFLPPTIMVDLIARHGSHHYDNVAYGYWFAGAYTIGLAFIMLKNYVNPRLKRRLGYNVQPPVWIYLIIWAFLVLIFAYYHTPKTLNGNCKRLGRISYAGLPLSLLLSLKPSPLPSTYYISLIGFHKWVSRTLVLLGAIHGIGYCVYFILNGKSRKIFKLNNFLGVVMLLCFVVMTVSSIRPIRSRFYSFFFRLHYPLAWAVIILGIFHARPGVEFFAGWCIFALCAAVVFRIIRSTGVKSLDVSELSPSLLYITLPRDTVPDWFPVGSHLRISDRLISPLTWISSSHPYTIASLASDSHVKLLVRKTKYNLQLPKWYSIQTAFVSPLESELVKAKKVLIIAGGSGLSMAAPIVRFLELRKSASLKLIWVTRYREDTRAIDLLNVDPSIMEIYVSRDLENSGEITPDYAELDAGPRDDTYDGSDIEFDELSPINSREDTLDESDDDFPMSTGETLVDAASKIPTAPNITYGRPDLKTIGDSFMKSSDHGNLTTYVVSCGPPSLVSEVSTWAYKHRYQFFGEKYAL